MNGDNVRSKEVMNWRMSVRRIITEYDGMYFTAFTSACWQKLLLADRVTEAGDSAENKEFI